MDAGAERVTLVTRGGQILGHNSALHALIWLWCHAGPNDSEKLGIAVPVTASNIVERIAGECGRTVVRTGTSRRALSTAALRPDIGLAGSRRGGFVFPQFLAAYDAVMTLGMLLRMLDHQQTTLDEVVATLPPYFLRDRAVFCPFDRKGAVMRTMAALSPGGDMVEGVRIEADGGWAHVLPHATEALVHVFTEGENAASADALLERYVAEVERAIEAG